MATRLDEVKRQAALDEGALRFFRAHRELNSCEANVKLLSSEVVLKNLPLDDLASWETAHAVVGSQLAPKVKAAEPYTQSEIQKWPYPWCPEIHSYADIQAIPPKTYRDLYFDKRGGELTERAIQFRAIVQDILDKENARRSNR
jgi:hypothetical protein